MAEYSIIMKQKNNQGDYDILYPKTLGSQVEGTIPSSQITGTFPSSSITGQFPASQIDDIYTKDQTLTQATAALLGLGSDATPDDAFKVLEGDRFKVGDILATARTNLGENWLLCNGGAADGSYYPDLKKILPTSLVGSWDVLTITDINISGNYSNRGLCYCNGYWILTFDSAANPMKGFYYTSDPLHGPWMFTSIPDMNSSSYPCATGATYKNGYYIIYSVGTIFFSKSISNGFSSRVLITGNYNYGITTLDYGNGYWLAGSLLHGSMFYATSLSGPWTSKSSNIGTLSYGSSWVLYAGGYWFMSGYGNPGGVCQYSTNPTGTWTTATGFSGPNNNRRYCPAYINGYWIVPSGTDGYYYSNNLANDFTRVIMPSDVPGQVLSVSGENRYAVFAPNSNFGYLYVLDGIPNGNLIKIDTSLPLVEFVGYGDGRFFIADFTGNTLRFYHASMNDSLLPSISVDGAYAYIRAKE